MSKSDYQQAFDEAITAWRQRHQVRDDDVVLLCVELFRIHQTHWDGIRRQDFPPFQEFRDTVLKLTDTAVLFQRHSALLLEELQRRSTVRHGASSARVAILVAVVVAFSVGWLAGRFLVFR